jgi:uncharacterized protein YrzB (UPF0473 family)
MLVTSSFFIKTLQFLYIFVKIQSVFTPKVSIILRETGYECRSGAVNSNPQCAGTEIAMSENQNDDFNANDYATVTLSLDDGSQCECAIIRIFPAGDRNYIALLPLEGEAADNDEVYLYRYTENDGGEPTLENIDSDDEYEVVSEAFDEELDAMEYEELYEDEE